MTKQLPTFSEEVSLFVLDDIGIVFSEGTQEIYELNASATYIWCLLDEGKTPAQVTRGLEEMLGCPTSRAQEILQEAFTDWSERGFFASTPRLRKAPSNNKVRPSSNLKSIAKQLSKAVVQHFEDSDPGIVRCYRSFDTLSRVSYPDAVIERWVHPVMAHLEIPCGRTGRGTQDIRVVKQKDGFVIERNGRPATRCKAENEVAPLVQYYVHFEGIIRRGWSVAFHAAAVSDGERILVLPGDAGSGKSSLTAALLSRGYGYLTDDLLLMQQDLTIEGVPFCLCVKESGVPVIEKYFPAVTSLPKHLRSDKKTVRYLPVPITKNDSSQNRLRPTWIVFPRHQVGAGTSLEPITRSEAIRRLLATCDLSSPLSKEQVAKFVSWLRGLDCYHLTIDSLDDGASHVVDLMKGKAHSSQR